MKVAVLGCGTIGRGVVEILRKGINGVELYKILDKKERFIKEFEELFTDNVEEILHDESIDTVVEVMGGKEFSYYCVKNALLAGKNVVTANKELIAYKLKELSAIADEKGVYLLYEASVGGGIPFLKTISDLVEFNEVESIFGILNGTTNYILTKMQREKSDYASALAEAQKLGFAEANPTADVEGHDLVRKIAILAMLSFKQSIDVDKIFHYGISGVTADFMEYVETLGYTLKYACMATRADTIDIAVEPVLVKNGDVAANVEYENNIVRFIMQPNDALTFVGKGAGRMPTASAIVSDIIVARDKGKRTCFVDENNLALGVSGKKVSAVVKKGDVVKVVENADIAEIRTNYDFYAIII